MTSFRRNGVLGSGGAVTGGSSLNTFNYDANGNRTSAVENGATSTYGSNNLNQYSSVTGLAAPTYDGNGNLKTYDGWTYDYDAMNRLTHAGKGTTHAYYWYDGVNRQCTWQINGDVTFSIWDGWNLVEGYKKGDTPGASYFDASYLHGAGSDELISMTRAGQTYYFFQDGRGNTSHLADSAGQLIERYEYDVHGTPLIYAPGATQRTASAYGVRHLFQGREYLKETGLYDYRNRFYHPDLGRFLQPDPVGFASDPANLYRYCGGDPVNKSDPDGRFANFIIGAAAGAGIDFGVQLWQNGGNFRAVNYWQVGISGAVGATGVGLSAVIGRTIVGTSAVGIGGRIITNAAVGAATAVPAQIAINASNGQNLTDNLGLASAVNAIAGAAGSVVSELGQALAAAASAAAFDAASIEQKLLASSNAITSFTDNASLLPGIFEGAGIAASNSAPFASLFSGGSGGAEGRSFTDGGYVSSFSPSGNSFTTAEGNSAFGGGFIVLVGTAEIQAFDSSIDHWKQVQGGK